MRLVDLVGIQLEAPGSVLVLREHEAPFRILPIVVGGSEATSIAIAASGQSAPRPLSHDLMATLVESLDAHLDAVEVTDLRDGTFIANLALTAPVGERRIDTRPSDAIALAVRLDAPVYVSEHVLDEAGAVPTVELDDDTIDAEVNEFHEFLADVDPTDFLAPEADGRDNVPDRDHVDDGDGDDDDDGESLGGTDQPG